MSTRRLAGGTRHEGVSKRTRNKHIAQRGLCWYCGQRCEPRRPYNPDDPRGNDARLERQRDTDGRILQLVMYCRQCEQDRALWSSLRAMSGGNDE